jgi:hypothetical protein
MAGLVPAIAILGDPRPARPSDGNISRRRSCTDANLKQGILSVVIPGRGLQPANPESSRRAQRSCLDSGFGPSGRPGMTKRQASSPVFFAARGRPYSYFLPRELGVRGSRPPPKMRGYGAPMKRVSSAVAHLPFGKMRRLSARRGCVLQRRAALPATVSGSSKVSPIQPLLGGRIVKPQTDPCGPQSASSSRQVIVPAGGAPSSPGSLGGAFISRPRAPHPAPPTSRLMRAPSVEQDGEDYAPQKNRNIFIPVLSGCRAGFF